jgi:peptidoglycan hydrolase-like protein with peptidoglycan-binding domain
MICSSVNRLLCMRALGGGRSTQEPTFVRDQLSVTAQVFPFLGFAIDGGRTKLLGASVRRATRRFRAMEGLIAAGRLGTDDLARSQRAWLAHAQHADRKGVVRVVLGARLAPERSATTAR